MGSLGKSPFLGGLPGKFPLGGSFRNFGYLGGSRESPISEFGIPRSVFAESIGGLSFGLLKNDLLTDMAINDKLSEKLKRLYTIVYREDHLSWG